MKYRRLRKYFFSLALFLFLILILLFPAQARNGASSGLLLWFNVLLPTLLPFIIMSDLIRRLRIIDSACDKLSLLTGKNLYFLYPLLLGLLCGLPLGAKLTADAVRSGQLSKKHGQLLLTVCNNSSAMFLMGYVADAQLHNPSLTSWFLLLIPLASLLAAFISSPPARHINAHANHRTIVSKSLLANTAASPSMISSVSASIMDGFTVITQIGGFVILFSVLAEFVLLIQSPLTLPLVASLEITTGIRAICDSALTQRTKILLSASAASFTGFSGIAQTACVLSGTGLSLPRYICSRIISAFITVLLFVLFMS